MFAKSTVIALLGAASVSGKVYFKETFDGSTASWTDRWVSSTAKGSDAAEFELVTPQFSLDENNVGLKSPKDSKYYAASAKFEESVDNEGKDLVVQYQLKHEQDISCGGGYIKLYASDIVQEDLNGETPYNIMFGPDMCGTTKRIHVIFTYKGKNYLKKNDIPYERDNMSHVYTLVVKPDHTYKVLVDMKAVTEGSLFEDFEFLPPKEIPDPEDKKPSDWVDDAMINDETDTKPEDWDVPMEIQDPEAEKPEDWDDEDDGEWEAPMIPNPDYKGDWQQKQIENPDYKGPWVQKKIPNPDYSEDVELYRFTDSGAIGIDIWQVQAGSIFDNILVADDFADAEAFYEEIGLAKLQKNEKDALEKEKLEKQKAEEAEQMFNIPPSKAGDMDIDEDEDEDEDDARDEL